MSEISAKTAAQTETLSTFVTLRFSGDRLVPEEITAVVGVPPTLAYRKGEAYRTGAGGQTATGRTGVWYLSTRRVLDSRRLSDHLDHLVNILSPTDGSDHVAALRDLMARDGSEVDISCFWHGKHGAVPPVIPRSIGAAFARLGATIESDFDTD
jgi:Domain of unknown function (DUF4279)